MSNLKDKIKHVVVLMLENRSLDNMMGFLYPDRPEFNGITPNTYYNKIHATGKVYAQPLPSSLTTGCLKNPSPDPGEGFDHVNTELNITPETPLGDNSGFLRDYFQVTGSATLAPHIMYSYTPEQVPIISTLAKHFAVSDQWFCSAPTETFPNRLYVATGTSAGLLYDGALFDPDFFQYLADLPTVFNMFEDSGKTWKSYFHDVAFNWVLLQDGSFTSPNIDSYELHFQSDLDGDNFPDYAFIEPAYAFFPNDEHPPHDVTAGEALIADVYNRICQSQYWKAPCSSSPMMNMAAVMTTSRRRPRRRPTRSTRPIRHSILIAMACASPRSSSRPTSRGGRLCGPCRIGTSRPPTCPSITPRSSRP